MIMRKASEHDVIQDFVPYAMLVTGKYDAPVETLCQSNISLRLPQLLRDGGAC